MPPAGTLEAVATPEPLDRALFESDLLTVGSFRAHPGHPRFHDSGPIQRHIFVFPRTSVWIRHEGRRQFVADPNVVTYYNRNQVYRRDRLSADGDRCEWFALHPRVLGEVMADMDPTVGDRPDRPFPFSHGPSDAASYLAQRIVVSHVRTEARPDALFAEDTMLRVLAQVISGAYQQRGLVPPAPREDSRQAELAEEARSVLAVRFRENLGLAQLAAAVGTSVYHLCRTFRRRTGVTLHAYRNQLRLRTALEAVAEGGLGLTDLALDLGFSSHSHFTDTFRRAFGVPPTGVRGMGALRRQALTQRLVQGDREA